MKVAISINLDFDEIPEYSIDMIQQSKEKHLKSLLEDIQIITKDYKHTKNHNLFINSINEIRERLMQFDLVLDNVSRITLDYMNIFIEKEKEKLSISKKEITEESEINEENILERNLEQ